MADVDDLFINPLYKLFDKPSARDAGAFLENLRDDLGEFSREALVGGARIIRRTRRFSTFPTIAECVVACREAEASLPRSVLPSNVEPRLIDRPEYRAACLSCRCDLGRRADSEGWLNTLIEFVVKSGRLPIGREIDRCAATADQARRNIDDTGELRSAMQNFRLKMSQRAARDVFGEVEPA